MVNLLKIAIVLIVLTPMPAFTAQVGRWQSGTVQGVTKYWTENNSGDQFAIWCRPHRNKPVSLIGINIDGHSAPPDQPVQIVIDHGKVKLTADGHGYLRTNCFTCADSFVYLWNQLRSSTQLTVVFADERRAGFQLEGAETILPGPVCAAKAGGK